ncbi:hypothetical protein ACL02T_23135 [Pseudonocardia sp. RS010]|uniref:hypothetical protein n=1 Tax=Pseudonocardia sp. RS010 TaxID=3385979 RepID=UPI0039A311D3
MVGLLLIDQFMPEYHFCIVFSWVFRAPPARSFETFVGSDLLRIPLLRALIGAREIPQFVADAMRHGDEDSEVHFGRPTFRLRDMPSTGWVLLGERPGAELAFGRVSKGVGGAGRHAGRARRTGRVRRLRPSGVRHAGGEHAGGSVWRAGVDRDRRVTGPVTRRFCSRPTAAGRWSTSVGAACPTRGEGCTEKVTGE